MTAVSDIDRLRELLGRRLGWSFAARDSDHLDRLLDERGARHGLTRREYLDRLAGREWDAELTELIERLSITETYFFRHGEQFRALRDEALPELFAARAGRRVLRLLSVACSSGEEAYSLSIVAREARPDAAWTFSVLGIDANPAMLRTAHLARYSPWSLRETPAGIRQRWFRPDDNCYEVAEEVRAPVQFQQYNVAGDDDSLWSPERYDVIFCRNLLMYLTPAVASALVGRMTRALAPGGFLFLGHTDSLGRRPPGLDLRHGQHTFYYQRPVSPPAQRTVPVDPPPGGRVAPEVEDDVYNRAVTLLGDERFAEALDVIAAGLPDRPLPRDQLLHGVLLAQAGRMDEAAAAARRLIDNDALYADAHQLLGLCLEGAGAVDDATGQYRLAAYLDPAFALPRLRLGQLARRHGDDRDAAGQLERALTLLSTEDAERITLFGGGFGRVTLTALCRGELDAVVAS